MENRCFGPVNLGSSRPGEFHPQPLTEPCLIVSHHTALRDEIHPEVNPLHLTARSSRMRLSDKSASPRGTLRSKPITGSSTLLRSHPPSRNASLVSALWEHHLYLSINITSRLLLFRKSASSKVLPPLCRIRCGQPSPVRQSRTCPKGLTVPYVFESQPFFDTSSVVHLHSTPLMSPGAVVPPLFPLPFNTGLSRSKHRRVVCRASSGRALCDGPTIIASTA